MKKLIRIVQSDTDGAAIYIGDEKKFEDHSIHRREVLELLEDNQPFMIIWYEITDTKWYEENGELPSSFADLMATGKCE
jgi:hypothetical protein